MKNSLGNLYVMHYSPCSNAKACTSQWPFTAGDDQLFTYQTALGLQLTYFHKRLIGNYCYYLTDLFLLWQAGSKTLSLNIIMSSKVIHVCILSALSRPSSRSDWFILTRENHQTPSPGPGRYRSPITCKMYLIYQKYWWYKYHHL